MISPCLKICTLNPVTKICEGCGRTLYEIANWLNFTPEQREKSMEEAQKRLEVKSAPSCD